MSRTKTKETNVLYYLRNNCIFYCGFNVTFQNNKYALNLEPIGPGPLKFHILKKLRSTLRIGTKNPRTQEQKALDKLVKSSLFHSEDCEFESRTPCQTKKFKEDI